MIEVDQGRSGKGLKERSIQDIGQVLTGGFGERT